MSSGHPADNNSIIAIHYWVLSGCFAVAEFQVYLDLLGGESLSFLQKSLLIIAAYKFNTLIYKI